MDANIQKYQAFVETVRTGSFTRAARSLSYTQSGVSRMIADLERDWGMTLLERSRAGVTLTSEGRAVLPFVEGVCGDYRRLESQIDDLNGLAAGSIRIGTFSSVATLILPKVIGRFQKDYPAIEYELLMGDYTEIDGWVASGRVDFGFLPRVPRYSGLAERVVERDELMAVLPVGHRLAGPRRKDTGMNWRTTAWPAMTRGSAFTTSHEGLVFSPPKGSKPVTRIFSMRATSRGQRATLTQKTGARQYSSGRR